MEIRTLRDHGLSKRSAAKRLGLHRNTVAKYWDGPAEAPEAPRYRTRALQIDPYRDYITQRLTAYPELSAKRIHEELVERGYPGSYRSVRRYVAGVRPRQARLYTPIQTLPGEQAQVDWGHVGSIVIEGRRYPLYAFVFTLSWSRLIYVEFVTSLSTAVCLGSLERALRYVGGVPRTILFDNAKAVVSERVGDLVRFNEALLRFALAAGFRPKACWAYDAESKGKVESAVKYIKGGFFYGRPWTDLADLNRQACRWCDEVANRRVHGTTHEVPTVRLETEQAHLAAVPAELPTYVLETRRVSKDRQISIDGNRYFIAQVPPQTRVRYRRYEAHVEVDVGNRPVHVPLVYGYREPEVPPPARAHRKHPLQAAFEALAPNAPAYLQGLTRSRSGHLREQMQRIIQLAGSWPAAEVECAMARAIQYEAYGYGRLARILQHQRHIGAGPAQVAAAASQDAPSAAPALALEHRDLAYYAQAGWSQ